MSARGTVRGAAAPLLVLLSAFLCGCAAPRGYLATPGPFDRVPPAALEVLSAARLAFERGALRRAHESLAPLAAANPRCLPVRAFLQESELAILVREGALGDLRCASPEEARATLFAAYERTAEGHTRVEDFVLAARLAADGEQALALLDEADTIDARCIWVHYARAWWRHRSRRFKEARESLQAALRLDPGHLPTLRLEAILRAGAGESEEAAEILEVWLERTAGDPLYAAAERADALLDLAALNVLLGDPSEALELLGELDPRAVRDPARAEEVRAAAHEARGEVTLALEAVERAIRAKPSAVLPLAQRALLLRLAKDKEGERRAWLELVARTEGATPADGPDGIDFEAVLFRLQARACLERLALEP